MPATYEIYVDWSGGTAFTGTQDNISTDVLSMHWVRGRESDLENTPAGILELTVKDLNRDYSPENATSRFASGTVATLTVGRQVRIRGTLGGTVFNLWRGRIERIVPHAEPWDRTAYIYCLDGFDQLARVEILAPVPPGPLKNVTAGSDNVNRPITNILNQAGWPTGTTTNRMLDNGVDQYDYWWAVGESALDAIYKIETLERSFCYIDEQGRFVYEDRHHRQRTGTGGADDHLVSQGTFSNNMVKFEYELSARSIRNFAAVTAHTRATGSNTVLYSTEERPYIAASASATIFSVLSGPATAVTTPSTGVHWRAYSDFAGTGTNLSTSVVVTFSFYGQVARHVFHNTGTVGVYIVPGTGTIWGTSATSTGTQTMAFEGKPLLDSQLLYQSVDATSTGTFGMRGIDVDTHFWGNANAAQGYADWLVSRSKDPRPDYVRMVVDGANDTLTDLLLKLKISDRITVTASSLGISGTDYYINKVEHEVEAGRPHRTAFFLERVATATGTGSSAPYWLLGITGYSELGTSTKLYSGF